ncbi:MAG TPA: hypothetical protein VGF77_13380 [Allosphingosinicella sp.]|jgi:hypothetical protein
MSTGNPFVDRVVKLPWVQTGGREAKERQQIWDRFEPNVREWLSNGGKNPPDAVAEMVRLLEAIALQYIAVAEERVAAMPNQADLVARIQEWQGQLFFGLMKEIAVRQIAIGQLRPSEGSPQPD